MYNFSITEDLRKIILFVCFIHFSSGVFGQETVCYDKSFRSISEKATRNYRSFENVDSVVRMMEICEDTVIAKGFILPGEHISLANDFAHFMKGYGNPYQFKKEFTGMRGEIDYYKKGVRHRKVVSHSAKMYHGQIWSSDGSELLDKGNGEYIYTEQTSTFHQYFKDSVLTEMYEVRNIEQDTLYFVHDRMAEPRNGYQEFMQNLAQILKYPGLARLAGKEGIVYIQFIVSKEGKLTEFKPLTDEGFNLEKKAVAKLAKMPYWTPALFRGKPVKMKFVIPIRFRLI